MTDETAATPADVTGTPVDSTAPVGVSPEAQAPAGGTAPDALDALAPEVLATDEDEFEEIERGDKKYRIPKALKGELLMHQDYTQKTMTLAEQRRAVEAQAAEVERAKTLTTEERVAYGKLHSLHEQVQQYEQIDWDAYEATQPAEAQRHWRLYQTALNQRQNAISTLQNHEAQKTQAAQQDSAKRRTEVEAQVAKDIPNWPSRKVEIEEFASKHGYTPQVLAETASASDYKLLHFAEVGFKFIERQRAAARAAAAGAVKPAPEVGGTATAGLDPNSMSFEQYKAAREAGKL